MNGSGSPGFRGAVWAAGLVGGLLLLVGLVRWDRATRTTDVTAVDRPTITVGGAAAPPTVAPAAAMPAAPAAPTAAEREAMAGLREIEERVVQARDELNRVTDTLEKKQRELADAEKQAAANNRPVAVAARDEDRERLEKEIADLRGRVAEGDAKIKAAEDSLAKVRAEQAAKGKDQRPGAVNAAPKPVDPNTLGRGRIVDQQTKFDQRRFRDPAMPRFVANQAAVAAAGSSGAAAGGGGNFPGATAFGDIARGQAEFVRAVGERNLNDSKAFINVKTANAMELENKMALTETFFEMRRINRTARALEAGPRPTMDQVVQYARMQAPRRLSSLELDPLTGDINWPRVLTDKPYKRTREFVEDQFRLRAKNGGSVDYAQFEVFDKAMDSFEEKLEANVKKYRVADYGKGKNFLESLRVEYDLPVQ